MSFSKLKSTKYGEILICFLALAASCVAVFFPFFREPSRLLPSAGDGMKNYFTYLYHIKFDKELWRFEGMNYPFGENVVFTDNQPALAGLVKIIYRIRPMSDSMLIAIHNWTIFLGLVIGTLGFFMCLRYRKVPFVFSVLISIGVMFLQPQVFRLYSHFSMVYPFLPWVFYLWLRIFNDLRIWQSSVLIGMISVFAGLIHLYHFLAISVLCILALSFRYFFSFRWSGWLTGIKLATIQVFIPLVILTAMSNHVYPVPDRPAETWGFFSYTANVLSYFFSYKLPLFHFIDNNIIKIEPQKHTEAFNYIGLVAAVFVVGLMFRIIFNIRSLGKARLFDDGPSLLLFLIFIASAMMSFGLPFTIKGLEWLLEYAGPYKQFRSIGRLGWIGFYTINLLAWPWAIRKLDTLQDKFRAGVFKYMLVLILLSEGLLSIPDMTNPPQLIDAYSDRVPDVAVNTSEYQALLPDPYLHVGSECFGWPDMGGNQDQNFILGYKLGLPSLGVVMSRTGLSQSLLSNEFMCMPHKVPDIIRLIRSKDTRPLLVLKTKLDMHNKNVNLDHWTKDAPTVFENEKFALKRLELSAFDTIVARYNAAQQAAPVPSGITLPLALKQAADQDHWGFETTIPIDTTAAGEARLTFTAVCRANSDVNSIIDITQTSADGTVLKTDSHRANYYYWKIDGDYMFVSVPVTIIRHPGSLRIRISKYSQKRSDKEFFKDCKLVFAR